ncbi:MAG: respiratory nitrate reductase subunit gamma [Acidobacteriota bacterium]
MIQIPYIAAYVAIGAFTLIVMARILMWARMPMHLRWELYPVAHEAKKAHYGGSYLEESEWWTKPREQSLWGELKVMIPEILFLVALKENNPRLWYRSFPFHFGLYWVIGCTFLMGISGILSLVAPAAVENGPGTVLQYATVVLGGGGLCLSLAGALGLLHQRLSNQDLRDFTAPADIFNLVFFVIAFGLAFVNFAIIDPDYSKTTLFVKNLMTGNLASMAGTGLEAILPAITICAMSLLVIYIPLTHMSHFIGKYFAYHSIRWNDSPNMPGSKQERTINELLKQPISWAAPHIKADGRKTWVDVATDTSSEDQ